MLIGQLFLYLLDCFRSDRAEAEVPDQKPGFHPLNEVIEIPPSTLSNMQKQQADLCPLAI
jgi:hypothetical protein